MNESENHANTRGIRKLVIVSLIVISVVAVFVIIFKRPSYDLEKVHVDLRNLKEPFLSVDCMYFLDGGSIGMAVVDCDGKELKLAIPVDDNWERGDDYKRLFIGAAHKSDKRAAEVEFSEDTRIFISETARKYATSGEARDHFLIALGTIGDRISAVVRKVWQ